MSTTDVTRILPSKPTVFDSDYIPETKPEPVEKAYTTSFALTESLGSSLGEIFFPAPVKQETPETVQNIISTHSPTCQLCLRITDTYSMKDKLGTNLSPNTAPDRDLDWSLDANALTSIDTAIQSCKSQSLSPQERQIISPTNFQDSSNDDAHTTLQKDTNLQELTLSSTWSKDVTNTVCTISDVKDNSSSQELIEVTSRSGSQELTEVTSWSNHSSQEVTDTRPPDHQENVTQEVTLSKEVLSVEQENLLLNPELAQQDAPQLSEQGYLSLQDVTNINICQDDTDSETIIMEPELSIVSPQTMNATEVDVDTPKNEWIKQQLSSLGLPPDVFKANKDRYFLAESVYDHDIDFLHFMDIMDRSVSVTVANLSHEEISFEKEQLKTSSPISSSSTQTDETADETDSEKHDPPKVDQKQPKLA